MYMHRHGVDYTRHAAWTSIYFLSVAALMSAIFWPYIRSALQDFSAIPIVMLGIFIVLQLAAYLCFPRYVPEPTEYLRQHPDRDYLKIDWRRLVSKSMDILAQQVFIVLLVLFLTDAGLSLTETILAFTILFALLHVPLIASEYPAWPAWLFGGIVVVFSILFPVLILNVPYGFIYTYMLHWTFYMITAATFWLWHANRSYSA